MSLIPFLRRIVAFLIASLVASWMLAGRGHAHGEPAQLVFWGNFGTSTARCQRAIGHAAALCSLRAAQARARCHIEQMRGGECPPAEVDAAVQAARTHARAVVRRKCNAQQVQLLRYLDINEALTDVIGICRDLDTQLTNFAFAPWLADPEAVANLAAGHACIAATSAAATRLMQASIDSHRKALDRIATKNVSFARKQLAIEKSRARIVRATAASLLTVDDACPANSFVALYGSTNGEHFQALSAKAECFGGAVYVQDEIVCPAL